MAEVAAAAVATTGETWCGGQSLMVRACKHMMVDGNECVAAHATYTCRNVIHRTLESPGSLCWCVGLNRPAFTMADMLIRELTITDSGP